VSAKVWNAIVCGCLAAVPASAQTSSARQEVESGQQRYQIATLERVLEGAVEHGVAVTRDRLQAVAQMPTELLLSDNAHARGFRLEGYGVFFDVSVPSFETTLWTLRTLDQNDLGLDSAMKELQQIVRGNTNAEQALKRIELQVNPMGLVRTSANRPMVTDARNAVDSTASTAVDPPSQPSLDPILKDPDEAYRGEVIDALKDAMLEHSSSLGIGTNEWLTIAARGNDDRPRLAKSPSRRRWTASKSRSTELGAPLDLQ
jgi:hypothetical protein